MKKILLVSYYFPPFPGVGVFRWSQLSKYLARLGYEIHVVTVDWQFSGENSLEEEVKHPNIHIHKIPSGYPHNLLRKNFNNRILNGVRNKFFIHVLDRFAYPLEEAQRWGKHLQRHVPDIINQHDISIAIATGSPFFSIYHTVALKQHLPRLRVLADFRDPWARNGCAEYSGDLGIIQALIEKERYILENADGIVAVTEGVADLLHKTSSNKKIHIIRNGFDPDKFPSIEHVKQENNCPLIAHIGNVWSESEESCEAYLQAIDNLPVGRQKTVFIGSLPERLIKAYSNCFTLGKAEYLGVLSHDKTLAILGKANAAVQFNGRFNQPAASTKVYEHIAARKPTFSVNFGADITTLLEKHNWGISANPDVDDVKKVFASFLATLDSFSFEESDVNKYSYVTLAAQYDAVISSFT